MENRVKEHDSNPYAHNAMTSRLLDANTRPLTKRVEVLEQFKAQAITLGGIALLILGGVVAAVAERIVAHGF